MELNQDRHVSAGLWALADLSRKKKIYKKKNALAEVTAIIPILLKWQIKL